MSSDILFVSMENWDAIWRRNQFVCDGLARRHPDRKILFVGLARDASNDLRRGRLSSKALTGEASPRLLPGLDNVWFMRPLKLLPNTLAAGRKFNENLFRANVRRAAQEVGLNNPVLWLNPHSAVHMIGQMGEAATIYDITDDWISLTQRPALSRLITQQDAELCRRADATIVCSQRLFEMKTSLAKRLHLIPNGVDAAHYEAVLDGDGPLPEIARDWKHPVLGYTGSIHPDRVDVGLVEALAKRFASGTVALVGPDMLPTADRERLLSCGVRLPGPVPYQQIPDVMRAFDVCLTPHRMTPFTESLNPIKLWEYLAGGKPIVSTDVAGFRDYPRWVRLAHDAESFAREVEAALQEPRELGLERRREAEAHGWNARLHEIERVLAEVMG